MLDQARRKFIALLGGATTAWAVATRAQQPAGKPRRLGVILPYREDDPQSQARTDALRATLREAGWIEGRNLQSIYRWDATEPERIRAYARDIVGLEPDLIVANSTPVATAVLRETRTIPIVFVSVTDPIGQGLVTSFARPGGNVTGFTNIEPSFGGKMMAVLKEIAPGITRVAALYNPVSNPSTVDYLRVMDQIAPSLFVKTIAAPVYTPADIETALEELSGQPGGGLTVMLDTFVTAHRRLIFSLSDRYRLPAIYPVPYFAREGALVAIGADIVDLFRRAGVYVDRILKGNKPADLPVQAPVKFETIINLKTAKALGLTVPDKLLATADEVIE
jgi:putative ABC transport system substrate-binding protein